MMLDSLAEVQMFDFQDTHRCRRRGVQWSWLSATVGCHAAGRTVLGRGQSCAIRKFEIPPATAGGAHDWQLPLILQCIHSITSAPLETSPPVRNKMQRHALGE